MSALLVADLAWAALGDVSEDAGGIDDIADERPQGCRAGDFARERRQRRSRHVPAGRGTGRAGAAATWRRGLAWALIEGVLALSYYRGKNEAIAAAGRRTIDAVLGDLAMEMTP